MARTNKYASLNFNDIYEKKNPTTTSSSSSSSQSASLPNKTVLSNSRIHGNMLVLTRPTPKPKPIIHPPPPQSSSSSSNPPPPALQNQFESDSISLRPLGRTGTNPPLVSLSPLTPSKDKDLSLSPKTNRFVPPHLRPGFLGREEKPGPEFQKQPGSGVRSRELNSRQGYSGSPNFYGEEGRPKSGGGYERMIRRGFESDPLDMNRPGSSGSRPSSSG